MIENVTKTICRQCHADCRVMVHTRDGKLVKVSQDRTDPRVDIMLPPTIPPCSVTCPANLDVRGYVKFISEGKYRDALDLIKYDIPFPGIIGRICHHPCETECDRAEFSCRPVRPVAGTALRATRKYWFFCRARGCC